MGFLSIFSLLFFCACSSVKQPTEDLSDLDFSSQFVMGVEEKTAKVLYLLQKQGLRRALDAYFLEHEQEERFFILSKLLTTFLQQGLQKNQLKHHLYAIFASGIAGRLDPFVFEEGLESPDPQTQFASLYFLSQMFDDEADLVIEKAFASPYDSIRLQAAFYLAKKQKGQEQIQTLMAKLPSDYHPFFPQLFAMLGGKEATAVLRGLLARGDQELSLQSIHAISDFQRDDFLQDLRRSLLQHDLVLQEASAKALGVLQDSKSISQLKTFVKSEHLHLRLSALEALLILGDTEALEGIHELAKTGNLNAIILLGKHGKEIPLLKALSKSPDLQVKSNAYIALLFAKQISFKGLQELLCIDERQLLLKKQFSPGASLFSYRRELLDRTMPEYLQKELSLHLREELLVEASKLPQFVELAESLFSQEDLLPLLMQLLSDNPDPKAFVLLEEKSQFFGNQLLRDYAKLALYKKQADPILRQSLINFLELYAKEESVRFRHYLPFFIDKKEKDFQAEQRTRLFIEISQELSCSTEGLEALLHIMKNLSPDKQYLLAGIVLHAIE